MFNEEGVSDSESDPVSASLDLLLFRLVPKSLGFFFLFTFPFDLLVRF